MIDYDHLRDMQAVLGEDRSVVMLRSLMNELSSGPAIITRCIAAGDLAAARVAAHRLRGVALGMGCTRVAIVSGHIETGAGATLPDDARDLAAAAAITASMIEDDIDERR